MGSAADVAARIACRTLTARAHGDLRHRAAAEHRVLRVSRAGMRFHISALVCSSAAPIAVSLMPAVVASEDGDAASQNAAAAIAGRRRSRSLLSRQARVRLPARRATVTLSARPALTALPKAGQTNRGPFGPGSSGPCCVCVCMGGLRLCSNVCC